MGRKGVVILKAVFANRHIFDGQVNGKPIRLLLSFDRDRALRLKGAADGQSMVVDHGALDSSYDMGKYGSVDVADVTASMFPELCDVEVSDVQELAWKGIRVGITLNAASGRSFHIWNDGDELHWGGDTDLSEYDWLDGEMPKACERIEF